MSMPEKGNTLHSRLHFNFHRICDRSVVSLTPLGGTRNLYAADPKAQGGVEGAVVGDTFD